MRGGRRGRKVQSDYLHRRVRVGRAGQVILRIYRFHVKGEIPGPKSPCQGDTHSFEARLRTRLNIELNFPPKLRGARSRLYRRRFLQVNTGWKALAEIYTMHSFAPFFKLRISAKNLQHVFAIEYGISDVFHFSPSNVALFSANF